MYVGNIIIKVHNKCTYLLLRFAIGASDFVVRTQSYFRRMIWSDISEWRRRPRVKTHIMYTVHIILIYILYYNFPFISPSSVHILCLVHFHTLYTYVYLRTYREYVCRVGFNTLWLLLLLLCTNGGGGGLRKRAIMPGPRLRCTDRSQTRGACVCLCLRGGGGWSQTWPGAMGGKGWAGERWGMGGEREGEPGQTSKIGRRPNIYITRGH